MSSILFNPFKSAADQAEQKLAQYVDSSSLGRLLRGTKSELTKRWAGTALLLNDGKVEVVPAEGEFVRILENTHRCHDVHVHARRQFALAFHFPEAEVVQLPLEA